MTYMTRATMVDLLRMCQDARPDEIEQYKAFVGPEWNVEDVVNDLFNRAGFKFALMDGNLPFCVGGWEPLIEGVYQGWMVGTVDNWDKYWRSITKFCRQSVELMFNLEDTRRLQIGVLASREKTCEWYSRGMKFHYECTMKNFGLQGEDMAIYVKFREG